MCLKSLHLRKFICSVLLHFSVDELFTTVQIGLQETRRKQ